MSADYRADTLTAAAESPVFSRSPFPRGFEAAREYRGADTRLVAVVALDRRGLLR